MRILILYIIFITGSFALLQKRGLNAQGYAELRGFYNIKSIVAAVGVTVLPNYNAATQPKYYGAVPKKTNDGWIPNTIVTGETSYINCFDAVISALNSISGEVLSAYDLNTLQGMQQPLQQALTAFNTAYSIRNAALAQYGQNPNDKDYINHQDQADAVEDVLKAITGLQSDVCAIIQERSKQGK